jgi:hypothetical protein
VIVSTGAKTVVHNSFNDKPQATVFRHARRRLRLVVKRRNVCLLQLRIRT